MKMKKKVVILILVIVVVLLVLTGIIMYTDIGQEIKIFLYEQLELPKENIKIEELENVTIKYTYDGVEAESFEISTTDSELIEMIKEISNKKLANYSGSLMLAVLGKYTVDLGDDTKIQFDNYDEDGYVRIVNKDNSFLTKINPDILKKVVDIVDEKLTENIKIFETDKITISQKDNLEQIEITEKTAIDYLLEQCKNVYIKEVNYEPSIVTPDYQIDFNNNIVLNLYKENEKGWIFKDGILSEAYGLNSFDTIIDNVLENNETKREMFTTNLIVLTDNNKTIEITDIDSIEKITTPLIYSSISTPEWLENYDITDEYNNGIKVKINDYEYLIPGKINGVTIGNRYIISEDGKISLCFPLVSIDEYINELLGNKVDKSGGTTIIAVP